MSPIEICFKASVLLSIAFLVLPPLTAQTLEHRPPSVPESLAYFTSPGLGDRALQVLFHQLHYHLERIEAKTTWSTDLAEPLPLPDSVSSDSSPIQSP